jgi:DNA-binding XRE family transcriptional regulator
MEIGKITFRSFRRPDGMRHPRYRASVGHYYLSQPNILGKSLEKRVIAYYIRHMLTLSSIGAQIAVKRKKLGLTQAELAGKASISRATLDALENGRSGELGFSKITKILSALGLGLKLQESGSQRPTLDELIEEDRNDQGLDRRR